MRHYKNIFFDLDDTLYDFSTASREAFKETYDLLEYGRFFESFEQYMDIYTPRNLELWDIYGRGEITKDELNRIRYSHPLEVVGVHDSGLAMLFCREALGRIPTKNTLIPGAKELLDYLAPKYNLFILSNGFRELQSHKMKTTGILGYFKDIILSDHIGVNKPGAALFLHALEKTGSQKEDSIMVGDMFGTDIVGAAGIGMEQIFLNRKGETELPFRPTYEVHSLADIMLLL